MEIKYIDRKRNQIESEKIYGRWILSLLYGESCMARMFAYIFLPLLSRMPWVSKFYGYLQKRQASSRKIQPFIAAFHIDSSEFQTTNFSSFNDFFIRKLKPEKRPIFPDPNRAVLPADGRYFVFPNLQTTDGFYMKGQELNLVSFLQDSALAHRLSDGSMVIARLCPTDYHRFHFPCSGVPSVARPIDGPLFSVNPVALRKKFSILSENKRMITEMDTDKFGTLFIVEVGATCVGTIHQTYVPGSVVQKGEEKGFFSFGGSCLVLLFERGRIQFDEDLIRNSKNGFETKALFGGSLGST
ncbi:MAG TPA: phosphatidylserine decarboxylase [Chlamydiales bacterium]|nr:phosphatidylserine decarboxylase [Chlamydiales bacterium]